MKETTLTIEQIEAALTVYTSSPFYLRRNLVIPNVSWGYLNHEADLLVLTKAGYLTEVEIKRSWADFVADFEKRHGHKDKKLSHLYYAVPLSIGERVFHYLYDGDFSARGLGYGYSDSKVSAYTERNINKAGLILYAAPEELNGAFRVPMSGINVVAGRMGNYMVPVNEQLKLLRLLGMRVWSMKKKLAKLQNK